MSHPSSDNLLNDPRKKWSFNEVRVCECMNSIWIKSIHPCQCDFSVVLRKPKALWVVTFVPWLVEQAGRWTPICLYPWPQIPNPLQYTDFAWNEKDKGKGNHSVIGLWPGVLADMYTCVYLKEKQKHISYKQTLLFFHIHQQRSIQIHFLQCTCDTQSLGRILWLHNNLYLNPFLAWELVSVSHDSNFRSLSTY